MRALVNLIWILLAVLVAWGLAIGVLFMTPQELAILLGLSCFMLLASRLLWGYAALGTFVQAVLAGKSPNRERAEAEVHLPNPELLETGVLAAMWLAALDPYRYAFFVGYIVLALVTLASKFTLPLPADAWTWVSGTLLIEGVFWGASVAALMVWGLALLASQLTGELLAREQQTAEAAAT